MRLTGSRFTRRGVVIAAVAAIVFTGCTDFSSTPDVLGHLIVTAKDASGAPVANINFTALLSDRVQEWAKVTTGASGSAEFREKDGGILPQTYIVRFDATNGNYTLNDGETNDKPITVVLGQTQTVTFTLKKLGPGGAPG
jgi:hypothetical protein